jgi:YgiT-type zinc finger domain-containing protein
MDKLTECPTCGSRKIKKVPKNLRSEWKGTPYLVPRLAFWECPACGERLFGQAAMQKIEARRPRTANARTHSGRSGENPTRHMKDGGQHPCSGSLPRSRL